jgi:hypothetical protein
METIIKQNFDERGDPIGVSYYLNERGEPIERVAGKRAEVALNGALLYGVGRVIATSIATPFSAVKLAVHGLISVFNDGSNHSSIEEIRTRTEKPIKQYNTEGYKTNIVYRFIQRLEESIMFVTSTR